MTVNQVCLFFITIILSIGCYYVGDQEAGKPILEAVIPML